MPEISVIMSVYNTREQILRDALDSVRNQTFQDFELLICDDGSTDNTWEVLKKLTAGDFRIRLFRSCRNRGAGFARNICIRAAKGRYIAVMDADDIAAPNRLEQEYAYLQKYPQTPFVGCRGEFFIRHIGDDGECYWFCRKPKAEDFLFSLPFVHASLMFQTKVILQIGGYDCSRRAVRVEDYDLLLRLYAKGYFGENLADILYYIRRDEQQYKRRKYRYRFHEAYMKYRHFKNLKLMPRGFLYAAKPLLAGLLPVRIRTALQKKYYARNTR